MYLLVMNYTFKIFSKGGVQRHIQFGSAAFRFVSCHVMKLSPLIDIPRPEAPILDIFVIVPCVLGAGLFP